jgi:hypothetical protein
VRTLGLVLLVGGLFGFYYASTRLSGFEPLPATVPIGEYLQYEAGKWELARYGSALAVLIGIVLSLFPKGR